MLCKLFDVNKRIASSVRLGQPSEDVSQAKSRTRGMNELYEHRMRKGCVESLTAELRDPHQFATWGIDCAASDKQFKVHQSACIFHFHHLIVFLMLCHISTVSLKLCHGCMNDQESTTNILDVIKIGHNLFYLYVTALKINAVYKNKYE